MHILLWEEWIRKQKLHRDLQKINRNRRELFLFLFDRFVLKYRNVIFKSFLFDWTGLGNFTPALRRSGLVTTNNTSVS
ncbi:hypothetical protein LEP1GSC029_0170 [Leptospira interrogans str. 2002000626]|uniref:Uncharacterized protein n=1 Tax=Leptospira interrogans str. 2002000626 TaxID=996803 RepID=A0A829D2Z4_LEPIR|nr:hypothetical protein LEP1GSC029_0170 [Leptospira interrogans str. 2002000626]